ncbi:45 kDa calcium-binding protein [Drosophila guanche]|uniref:Blast:45 kDa calcium-binding protein n=1 Tax=Drosophila guanche TaxID=7266 RepID=A0A3B0JS09_DROGU|nr:45 kDa calcium-binding protein [Drosophila guanche]SPP83783.1 blast:45 kDa calcium-binding protein [Drosophila guanche]
MTFVNKLSKSFRWLRCSTLCAILFYMFFIGLILHSTSHKLQQHQQEQRDQQREREQKNQKQGPASSHSSSSTSSAAAAAAAAAQEAAAAETNVGHNSRSRQQPHSLEASANHLDSNKEKVQGKTGAAGAAGAGTARGEAAAITGTSVLSSSKSSNQPETVILAASNVNEKQILAKAFKRADRNHDGRLSIQELGQYINRRIVEHIDEAIMNNAREFRRVDTGPADGLITWDEYHRFFLREHGMTEADIDEHDEIRHTALNRRAREDMMRDKARWSEAARTDLFTLTIDEYLSFRHPESSVSNLLELVDDLLRQFDQDGDDQLTLEEFSDLNVDDDDDLLRKSLISKTLVERREEFKRIIDKNHDGKADRGELLYYVNPKTPRYALQEAATLFSLCDENKDELLTLKEMTNNAEIFLQSKMIDTANSFHTEF